MMMMIQLKLYDERYRNIATTARSERLSIDFHSLRFLFPSPGRRRLLTLRLTLLTFWHNGKRIFKLSLARRAVASEEKVYDGRQCRVEYHREAKKRRRMESSNFFTVVSNFILLFPPGNRRRCRWKGVYWHSNGRMAEWVRELKCLCRGDESEISENIHIHHTLCCIMLELLALTFSHPTPNRKRPRAPIDL